MKKLITFFKDWAWQVALSLALCAVAIALITLMVKIVVSIIGYVWNIL